ncbi:MAG TPA: hypothetical protein ENG87_00255, partial [Candidatus Pacearchaeota archaeon]|nr:hypothetical protein [Candidatus Pacearchaeota archaeon]
MNFLFKKKEVPEELPDLAIEEVNEISERIEDSNSKIVYKPLPKQEDYLPNETELKSSEKETPPIIDPDEKSFFKEI